MARSTYFLALFVLLVPGFSSARTASEGGFVKYVLINLHASELKDETFAAIRQLQRDPSHRAPRIGVGAIVSYFRHPPEKCRAMLRSLLDLSRQHQLPVIVQLDGEQWWNHRPDLWNWWDSRRPGFDPTNAENVEWSGWEAEHALKIAWRNWGRQIRVLPPPNLMSARYRAACHAAMRPLLEEVLRWRGELSPDERSLLVGIKVGWESAIGMGSYYYENGNALLDADPSDDPLRRVRGNILPGRGFQPIGFAAVKTAGLASGGELQEGHLAEVVRRHLDDLSRVVREAGFPREQIFTHCGGWAEGESLYTAAINEHSCPGWSFYRHASDPRRDTTAMAALAGCDAPFFAAAEWLAVKASDAGAWHDAITRTLSVPRCRYLCIYNWRGIKDNAPALEGIRRAVATRPAHK